MKIIRNSAMCRICNTTIESKYVHDYQTCLCKQMFVDGGKAYLRRGARDGDMVLDTSIVEEDDMGENT